MSTVHLPIILLASFPLSSHSCPYTPSSYPLSRPVTGMHIYSLSSSNFISLRLFSFFLTDSPASLSAGLSLLHTLRSALAASTQAVASVIRKQPNRYGLPHRIGISGA
ncbi:hypothetical protein B0H19DRAFT_1270980 [Mycena capillaripes]|nr:hypothetical protein B0H19DRAFT_1270980 [Mycena capillaripes]